MRSRIDTRQVQLTEYQRQLVERLQPLLDQLDDDRVTGSSGLTVRKAGKNWALVLDVEPRIEVVPGLTLVAAPNQCILSFAGAEVFECHRDPGSASGLVDTVMSLTERYLSGTTVVEHHNRRGKAVRTEYFYGLDSEADPALKIGTGRSPFVFPRKVERTVKRSYRFVRDERAAEQAPAPEEHDS